MGRLERGADAGAAEAAGICFPNAAYDGIKKNQDRGVGTTEVMNLDTGDMTAVSHPDGKR